MELIHSTFQASFNARIERLAEQETNELRTIFWYFDTDGDGAVSADQAFRMFRLLGLEVNPAFVRDLGEVYLAEFLKIVDSHTPVAVDTTSPPHSNSSTGTSIVPPLVATCTAPQSGLALGDGPGLNGVVAPDEAALQKRNAQIWEEEWQTIDSYRRGHVTRDELRFFLRSCFSPFPLQDLDRFLELYSDPTMPEDSAVLTKTAFLKFRQDYTGRERAPSDPGTSSDEDDEDTESGHPAADPAMAQQMTPDERTGSHAPSDSLGSSDHRGSVAKVDRRVSQRASISHVQGGQEMDEIVIDPGAIDDDFAEEEDAADDLDDVSEGEDEEPIDEQDEDDSATEEAEDLME